MTRKLRVGLVSPYADTIISFRGELIHSLISNNIDVYVLAPDFNKELKDEIEKIGAYPIDYYLKRTSINPIKDLISIIDLLKKFRKLKLDIVFAYNHKPVIFSMIAAFINGIRKRFCLIEGLGFYFVDYDLTIQRKIIRKIMICLYTISLNLATKVFFLNIDDLSTMLKLTKISKNKTVLLGGIGIDLNKWKMLPAHLNPITFMLAARLIKEKGIIEFIEAAKYIKIRHPHARFIILGPLDKNPGKINESEVKKWVERGIIEWPGKVSNIKCYFEKTSVFVLASYREGVPRSIQEAMALGRPIITTDVPGCRETVIHGVNGFLVPPRDVFGLIKAMEEFINNPSLIIKMGRESRKIAEQKFNVYEKNAIILNEMFRN